jgi:dTDP-D-glucose 4,6-dehydratase
MGSHVLLQAIRCTEVHRVVYFGALTVSGHPGNLAEVDPDAKCRCVQVDVRDSPTIGGLLETERIDILAHIATATKTSSGR